MMKMLTFELVQAAECGNLDKVRRLLDDVDAEDMDGRTLLHVAIHHGQQDVAQFLLSRNANIDAKERFIGGFTPLHEAICCRCSLDLVKFLLHNGATINSQDDEGFTPLHHACTFHKCDHEVVQFLLRNGALVDSRDKKGRTPLLHATLHQNLGLMRLLLESGASVDYVDFEGRTPLLRAVQQSKSNSVKFLIDHGADIQAVSKHRQTPLSCAIQMGNAGAMFCMLQSSPDIWHQMAKILGVKALSR